MRVAFIQTRPVFGDVEGNVRRAMKRAASLAADLVVLPELFSTGYQFRSRAEARKLAEPARGSLAIRAARDVAHRTGAYLVGGFCEAAGRRVFNSAFLAGPEGPVRVYRKVHLFWDEKDAFDPGDRPFAVHDIGCAKVGLMICYDWAFPEAARSLALAGAQVIAHPANLVLAYCQQVMVTRCLENAVFAVTANRVGSEKRTATRLTFTGRSQITGPGGEVLAAGHERNVDARTVEIDPGRALDKRYTPKSDRFQDRRPRMYRLG